jgi:hypothetical protein
LTVEYSCNHDWAPIWRILETYAFRVSAFSFIGAVNGPLAYIALDEDAAYDPAMFDNLPPVGVRCLAGQPDKLFEFFEHEKKSGLSPGIFAL